MNQQRERPSNITSDACSMAMTARGDRGKHERQVQKNGLRSRLGLIRGAPDRRRTVTRDGRLQTEWRRVDYSPSATEARG